MIQFVYGAKGSGKTKKMIEMANAELETAKGQVLFVNDRDKYRTTVDTKIRFVNSDEFNILGYDQLLGFICGVTAANYDVDVIYIDNLLRIIDANEPKDIEPFLKKLEGIQETKAIKFVLSLSCAEDNIPDCVKSYLE